MPLPAPKPPAEPPPPPPPRVPGPTAGGGGGGVDSDWGSSSSFPFRSSVTSCHALLLIGFVSVILLSGSTSATSLQVRFPDSDFRLESQSASVTVQLKLMFASPSAFSILIVFASINLPFARNETLKLMSASTSSLKFTKTFTDRVSPTYTVSSASKSEIIRSSVLLAPKHHNLCWPIVYTLPLAITAVEPPLGKFQISFPVDASKQYVPSTPFGPVFPTINLPSLEITGEIVQPPMSSAFQSSFLFSGSMQ